MSLVTDLESRFPPGTALDRALDAALELVEPLGFSSLIYDYTPVPRTHDGVLITPNVIEARRVPGDMMGLWREGFYQLDPVQDAALATAAPFVWSHVGPQSAVMTRILAERHRPVLGYLRDTRMTCGVTVPIRLSEGDLATFTAIRVDAEPSFSTDARAVLHEIGLLGQTLHDAVFAGFDERLRRCAHVRLTKRERECISLSADGLTAKEIAYRLGRSIPTVTLHLNAATRKLGARNRFQAIARAAHYRLLDGAPQAA